MEYRKAEFTEETAEETTPSILTPEELAKWIPNVIGRDGLMMSVEQISARRLYLRQQLNGTSFQDKPDNALDRSRYYNEDGHRFFEDEEGRLCVLPESGISTSLANSRKENAEIPLEYINAKTKDFDWSLYEGQDTGKEKKMLNKYLMNYEKMAEQGMGLYIYSKVKGSGKTMLSCCLLNELANRYGCNIKFVNVLDLLEITKRSYSGDREAYDRIRNATVLCLDDIGAQMQKEWVETVLYQLINERYTERKVTLYTSNVTPDKLQIDDRIIDRIEARTYTITLPEVNVRRMKSRAEKADLLDSLK